jgi:asparagine synthase (glutamine-hydrolysing)
MQITTVESATEALPNVFEALNVVITCDARLDNREEVAAALGSDNEFPDSHLIAQAYRKWGEECPARLIGDYSFAIWDETRQILFCARDHLGVKPFYYVYRAGEVFAFASEPKALFCLNFLSKRVNEDRIAQYLALLAEDRESTFYSGISRLPAAHSMVIGATGHKLKRFWRAQPGTELRFRSASEYAEGFREIFTSAVKCRLRSRSAVGSALSGGLDSSSIACVARDFLRSSGSGELHTFSALFPNLPDTVRPRLDERQYMEAVLSTGGMKPHWILADNISPLCELDRVLCHMDEPVMAPNLYIHWTMFAACRVQNVRVFLDGTDGDTTVGLGLDLLSDLARSLRWVQVVRESRALASRTSAPIPLNRVIWNLAIRPLVPPQLTRFARRMLRKGTRKPFRPCAMREDFAIRSRIDDRVFRAPQSLRWRSEREKHAEILDAPFLQYGMEICDKSAAAFGIEARYPFFDKRLIEFCLAIPSSQKLCNGWTRMILRRAMAGTLPPAVRWRTDKADLSPGFTYGLARFERSRLARLVLNSTSPLGQYVDLQKAKTLYERYITDPVKFPSEAVSLYALANLSRWMDQL